MRLRAALAALFFTISCFPAQCLADKSPEIPVVTISGEIDPGGAKVVERVLNALDRQHYKAIIVEINSPGGEYESGFKIAKAIENADTKIVCIVDHMAASMAFYMLQSCDVRLMTRRSSLMIHQLFVVSQGEPSVITVTDMENAFRALDLDNQAMAEHEALRMRISVKDLQKRVKGSAQWWLGWKEAWYWGAVDGVVESTRAVKQALQAGKSWENLAKDVPQVEFPQAPVCEP